MLAQFRIQDKEVEGPPLEPSLAMIIDDYFMRACTDVLSLEIKEAYDTLMKPGSTNNLVKTELNGELKAKKTGISKQGTIKDGHARGVQNAIIRVSVALAQMANEILRPSDKASGPNMSLILERAMTGLKCAAYS